MIRNSEELIEAYRDTPGMEVFEDITTNACVQGVWDAQKYFSDLPNHVKRRDFSRAARSRIEQHWFNSLTKLSSQYGFHCETNDVKGYPHTVIHVGQFRFSLKKCDGAKLPTKCKYRKDDAKTNPHSEENVVNLFLPLDNFISHSLFGIVTYQIHGDFTLGAVKIVFPDCLYSESLETIDLLKKNPGKIPLNPFINDLIDEPEVLPAQYKQYISQEPRVKIKKKQQEGGK